jgi:competence protein ComEC
MRTSVVLSLVLAALASACGKAPTSPADDVGGEDTPSELRDTPPSAARTVAQPTLTVRVLKVADATGGGGDAIIVADSGGARPWHALIDAGGDHVAADYLKAAGVDTLDLMVLTHAHADHFGGMGRVFDAEHVRTFVYNGQVRTLASYQTVVDRARAEADSVAAPTAVWTMTLPGGGSVKVLPPMSNWIGTDTDDGSQINLSSIAVRVEQGSFSFLSAGDAELEADRTFAATYPALVRVTALKVGHHGSTDATDSAWLSATSPTVLIVSANGVTHPHGATLTLLDGWTRDLFCTPQHGIVTLLVDASGAYATRTADDARRRCAVGSDAY